MDETSRRDPAQGRAQSTVNPCSCLRLENPPRGCKWSTCCAPPVRLSPQLLSTLHVPNFLQAAFRDSRLSAVKELQPVEEMLWEGGRDAEGGGRKGKGRTGRDTLN